MSEQPCPRCGGRASEFPGLAAVPPPAAPGLRDELRDLLSRLDGWRQARIDATAYESPDEMVDVARRDLRAALAETPGEPPATEEPK
jgi:hypothetical protein